MESPPASPVVPASPAAPPAAAAAAAGAPSPPRRSPFRAARPGVPVTLPDGRTITLDASVLESATIGTREATPDCKYTRLLIFDGGWGGVDMVVKLAQLGYAAIVHLKGASSLAPMAELEEKLRGFPGGSHLEMKAEHEGVRLMFVAYKYNGKDTLYFVAPEGAATTAAGVPYMTKWPDEHRNVLSRAVPRPALPSRYFITFNRVDKHNQMRQHELNVESKWNTADPYFRIFCTLIGMTVVDTMLAVKAQSHPQHGVRAKSTLEFAELLCEEMLDNELDGKVYDASYGTTRKRPVNGAVLGGLEETKGEKHVLAPYGWKSDHVASLGKHSPGDYIIQHPCVICQMKTGYYCTRAECKHVTKGQLVAPAVCCTSKRGCHSEHVSTAEALKAGAAGASPSGDAAGKRRRRTTG